MAADSAQKIFTCETYIWFRRCPSVCKIKKEWTVDCYDCYGTDAWCKLCCGSGRVTSTECPRLLSSGADYLLPYFFDWKYSQYQAWPDGRGALYQPVKLRRAFEVLANYYANEEKKRIEKEVK